jgi:DNA repair protein SbcD/Mre11
MRLLHTGDWHLGKTLKGVDRLPEQQAVMAELVEVVEREAVDVVIVAGDVFESAAPSPDAQKLAWSTLLALRETGAVVVVIADNPDAAESFEAVRPVFAAAGVTMLGKAAAAAGGGVVELAAGGGDVRVALLPFVSQRGVVRAAQLMDLDAGEMGQEYADRVHQLIGLLTASFTPDAVNVVAAHAFVRGGRLGGGERDAQTINDYSISSQAFPAGASYVALGHLHRTQQIPGPCPIWYAGSPIAVDFGEVADVKGAVLVDAAPGTPAQVRQIALHSARRLITIAGTVEEISLAVASAGDALIRVIVNEPARAGLGEAVRSLHEGIIEVRLERSALGGRRSAGADRATRSPQDLFTAYLGENNTDDPRLSQLFNELLAADHAEHAGDADGIALCGGGE